MFSEVLDSGMACSNMVSCLIGERLLRVIAVSGAVSDHLKCSMGRVEAHKQISTDSNPGLQQSFTLRTCEESHVVCKISGLIHNSFIGTGGLEMDLYPIPSSSSKLQQTSQMLYLVLLSLAHGT